MTLVLEKTQVKELFKEAVTEVLRERSDLLYEVFAEVIEDFALAEAIKEGMATETVSREEVFRLLEATD